ncbi:hypothetical protein BH11VER1_BH11VER1_08180 [soil metagenome]
MHPFFHLSRGVASLDYVFCLHQTAFLLAIIEAFRFVCNDVFEKYCMTDLPEPLTHA